MKIFQEVQKNLAVLGLIPNQRQHKHWHLDWRAIFGVIKCLADIITIAVYVFTRAESIEEYMDSIFVLSVLISITMSYISVIFRSDILFKMIETAENESSFSKCCDLTFVQVFINTQFLLGVNNNPSLQPMYDKFNRIIEKSCEIIYLAATYVVVPGFVLPKVIVSYHTYFTTDAGSAAFELPFVAW